MPPSKSARRTSRSKPGRPAESDYDLSVFINCPFDADYQPLFHATIFAISDCGYVPHCALEVYDSGQVRIDRILSLVERCRFGIHDISRTELDPISNLPRFNMPLELGLFLGAQRFGGAVHGRKNCLILDREQYRYQRFISDISGQDVAAHGGDSVVLIRMIRDWLSTVAGGEPLPGGGAIGRRFAAFGQDLPSICAKLHLQVIELTFANHAYLVRTWLMEQAALPEQMP